MTGEVRRHNLGGILMDNSYFFAFDSKEEKRNLMDRIGFDSFRRTQCTNKRGQNYAFQKLKTRLKSRNLVVVKEKKNGTKTEATDIFSHNIKQLFLCQMN